MKKNNAQFYQLQIGLLCLFLISFTFISCEAEKDVPSDNKMIVKRCSMKDAILHSNMKINEAVDYIKRLQTKSIDNETAKLVYDEKSGLFYDDEKGLYATKDGDESYIFPVIQEDNSEKIKNITFSKNDNNEYDVYIVKYDYSKEDLSIYSKEELAQREIKYQPLLKNGVEYPVETQWIICVTTTTITDTWIEEHEGFVFVCVSTSTETICESGGSEGIYAANGGSTGGSGPPPGDSGVGGVGGNSTNPTNPNSPTTTTNTNPGNTILTALIIDGEISGEPNIDDNTVIQSLNQLTNRQEVKDRIVEIKGQVSTVQMEQGSEFFIDLDNPTNPFIREDLTPKYSGIRFNSIQFESIIRLHSHHNPLLEPVFSSDDIIGMARFYKSKRDLGAEDAFNATSILASNLGIHSIRVINPEKAYLFSQRLISSIYVDQLEKKYIKFVQNKAKDNCNCSENNEVYQQLLLEYLIQFLADQNTGLGLFSGTINADDSITWTR